MKRTKRIILKSILESIVLYGAETYNRQIIRDVKTSIRAEIIRDGFLQKICKKLKERSYKEHWSDEDNGSGRRNMWCDGSKKITVVRTCKKNGAKRCRRGGCAGSKCMEERLGEIVFSSCVVLVVIGFPVYYLGHKNLCIEESIKIKKIIFRCSIQKLNPD